MRRVLVVGVVVLTSLSAYGQRELTMNLKIVNTNGYNIGVHPKATAMRCGNLGRSLAIGRLSEIDGICKVARGEAHAELTGTASGFGNDKLSEWQLTVGGGKHSFRCLFGCSIKEDWSQCPGPDPWWKLSLGEPSCTASVIITVKEKKLPRK